MIDPQPAERAFVETLIGSDAVPEAVIVVVQYIAPDGASLSCVYHRTDDIPTPQAVGLLELAKYDIMGDARVGWADGHWKDGDG